MSCGHFRLEYLPLTLADSKVHSQFYSKKKKLESCSILTYVSIYAGLSCLYAFMMSTAIVCTIIVELKVRTPNGDYSLPVVTGGAAPQEGGVIVQARIAKPKGIPLYINDPKIYWVPEGWLQKGILLKFVVNTFHRLFPHYQQK